jgi:hypothetical protein
MSERAHRLGGDRVVLISVMRRIRRLVTAGEHESGQALLFVLIAVALLASIPLALATTTVDELPQTARNLNYEAAYEAAQAGVNDYVQHLDANEDYSIYCKTCAQGTNGNLAFTSWVQASTSPPEYYSYAPTNTSGLISLEVSGKAGTGADAVVRTFSYSIKPATSLNDVYWSNYETRDPLLGAILPGAPQGYQYCNVHYDQPDPYQADESGGAATGPPIESACEVSFQTGDVLNGPIYSNDTFRACGTPEFDSTVESGNIYNTAPATAGNNYAGVIVPSSGCGSDNPTYDGPAPTKVSNQTPRSASDDLTPARTYGCFITGGTSPSSLTPTNVTMTLTVSGSTTSVAWSGSSGTIVDNLASNHNSCTSPITVSNLTSGLIFVNGNVTISGQMTGGLDVVTCDSTSDVTGSQCLGSAQSNIIISGPLTYPTANKVMVSGEPVSDSHDALGLIAANFVEVNYTSNIEIDAAILALADSFYVNNWYGGSSYGTLSVFGSIAQNFRGPVGQSGGVGYVKNYNYDTSLQTLFPPFFIPPNGATWSPSSYTELAQGLSNSVCPGC